MIAGPAVGSITGIVSKPDTGSIKSFCPATLFISAIVKSPRNFSVSSFFFTLSFTPIPSIPLNKLPFSISSVSGFSNPSFSDDNLYALSKKLSIVISFTASGNSCGICIMSLTASLLSSSPLASL